MKITSAAMALLATHLPASTLARDCVVGSVEFEFQGPCTPGTVFEAYADQVFYVAGATASDCASSASSAATDLESKISSAGMSGVQALCDAVYAAQNKVPFSNAANRGTDLQFEGMFYNGRTDWQEEVETIYEKDDQTPSSVLKNDAAAVKAFYEGGAQGRRVEWPGELPNFQSSVEDSDGLATCTTNAAMCCWPKDRQANDANGNCAKPYDTNCVDKDVADNTNLCFVDVERGNASTGYESDNGFLNFPKDNNDGEGAIHCHGLAWSNNVNDHTARYKANNLFFVSMYDHMHQRGYVKNVPGAPMCGCVEQMPTVSRSDCTQVDLTETTKITYIAETKTFRSKLTHVEVDFNACQGIKNRNNDLWAYMARLYYQGDITPDQFGEAGRIITDNGCDEATRSHLNVMDYSRGYDHDVSTWTLVAGRDDMSNGHPYGKDAFSTVFFEHSLTAPTPVILRVCPNCVDTHKKIYYRRRTAVSEDFDLLNKILYHRNDGDGQNVWKEDFTLHSTYEDAVSDSNPWKCPNGKFNYGAPFDGECSPSGERVQNQYSIFNWYPGPQPDVAYYVNTPEGEGIAEMDLTTSNRYTPVYTDVDVGNVGYAGRTFEREDGAIIVTGSGSDIWHSVDSFHFFSQPWVGDIDVSVHVVAFNGIANNYAKTGIMLRANNDDNAAHVFAVFSGGVGVTMTARSSKKNGSYYPGWKKTNPVQKSSWLRLVKKGEDVTFYDKNESGEWVSKATTTIRFPEDSFRVGLAVSSVHNSYVSEAVFEDYVVEEVYSPTAAPTVSGAPTAWDALVEVGTAKVGTHSYNSENGISYYRGYGTGIWGTSDSFFFDNVEKSVDDGAFDVIAYTQHFHTGYMSAKGGIMIRDTNDPDSAHAFLGMSGYLLGATFQTRAAAGERTVHHGTHYVPNHHAWIRLSKAADSGTVTAYYRLTAEDEWIEIGSTEVSLGSRSVVQVGTAVTSGDPSGNGYVDLQMKDFEIVDTNAARKLLRA